jgi:hypothetical protein
LLSSLPKITISESSHRSKFIRSHPTSPNFENCNLTWIFLKSIREGFRICFWQPKRLSRVWTNNKFNRTHLLFFIINNARSACSWFHYLSKLNVHHGWSLVLWNKTNRARNWIEWRRRLPEKFSFGCTFYFFSWAKSLSCLLSDPKARFSSPASSSQVCWLFGNAIFLQLKEHLSSSKFKIRTEWTERVLEAVEVNGCSLERER